jgi:hypothetical protein
MGTDGRFCHRYPAPFLLLSVFLTGANPLRVAAGSGFGEAERVATPKGDNLDAVAASWTMEAEEDGLCCTGLHAMSASLICGPYDVARRALGGRPQRRARR